MPEKKNIKDITSKLEINNNKYTIIGIDLAPPINPDDVLHCTWSGGTFDCPLNKEEDTDNEE